MFDLGIYVDGLVIILIAGFLTWLLSIAKRDVSIVDSLWAPMFLLAAVAYLSHLADPSARALIVVALVGLWALRLTSYITWRNWGEAEDVCYQAIRERNQPGFTFKSLYLVFGLQGVIAWIVSLPLLAAILSDAPLGVFDWIGIGLWVIGMAFEALGDWQLARFKANPENRGKVLDSGLWRYSRHPNYFGNACIWWGLFLIAFSAGGWWSLISPILMTFLLLKVSGVALLEQDIGERRPAYKDYVRRTNAFIPGPPSAPDPHATSTEAKV